MAFFSGEALPAPRESSSAVPLPLDISLQYHPASVQALVVYGLLLPEDTAADMGLLAGSPMTASRRPFLLLKSFKASLAGAKLHRPWYRGHT